jgi:hypothetical protein
LDWGTRHLADGRPNRWFAATSGESCEAQRDDNWKLTHDVLS